MPVGVKPKIYSQPLLRNIGMTDLADLQEEVLPGYDETFVTYRDMRIFYKFKSQFVEWFALVCLIGAEATKSGHPTVGCGWFKTREDCIEWGKRIVDVERDHFRHDLMSRSIS